VIVLDASVLIAHLDDTDVHHRRSVQTLLAVADRPLGASTVTLAEVLIRPARADRLADAVSVLATIGVRELPLGADGAVRLAELRARTALKLPDCCVLLASLDVAADGVRTFDEPLAAAARRLGFPTG
jgi:predicted nucleic acid-binding protein